MLHVTDARVADEMTATALRLASERRARVVAVYTLEVPASRALSQIAPEDEARANQQLAEAEALGQLYGVQVISRLVRTRNAGRALVEEAERRGSEIIVLGSPGRSARSARLFGSTVDYVLRHARCKVMVGATPEWRGAARAVPPAPGGCAVTARNRVSLSSAPSSSVVGITLIVRTVAARGLGPQLGYILGPALTLAGLGRGWLALQLGEAALVARKLPVLQRVVGEDALFAAIYGTISSSLYFALGVVSLYALGLTPIILPVVGLLVALAAAAYAEAATATGGGSPLIVRRAFGDAAGFLVGWAILLDLLVVALLSALFVPRYAEAAIGQIGEMSGRSAEVIGVGVIVALGAGRLVPRVARTDLVRPLALVDMLAQLTLAALGLAALGHLDVLTSSIDLGVAPDLDVARLRAPDRARGLHGRRDRRRAAAGVGQPRAPAAADHAGRDRGDGRRLRRDRRRGARAAARARRARRRRATPATSR